MSDGVLPHGVFVPVEGEPIPNELADSGQSEPLLWTLQDGHRDEGDVRVRRLHRRRLAVVGRRCRRLTDCRIFLDPRFVGRRGLGLGRRRLPGLLVGPRVQVLRGRRAAFRWDVVRGRHTGGTPMFGVDGGGAPVRWQRKITRGAPSDRCPAALEAQLDGVPHRTRRSRAAAAVPPCRQRGPQGRQTLPTGGLDSSGRQLVAVAFAGGRRRRGARRLLLSVLLLGGLGGGVLAVS